MSPDVVPSNWDKFWRRSSVLVKRSCGRHVVLLFSGGHVSRKTRGNTHNALATSPPIYLHAAIQWGLPGWQFPFCNDLFIPCMTELVWTQTRDWEPNPVCLMCYGTKAVTWDISQNQTVLCLSSEPQSVHGHKVIKTERHRERQGHTEKLIVHWVQ